MNEDLYEEANEFEEPEISEETLKMIEDRKVQARIEEAKRAATLEADPDFAKMWRKVGDNWVPTEFAREGAYQRIAYAISLALGAANELKERISYSGEVFNDGEVFDLDNVEFYHEGDVDRLKAQLDAIKLAIAPYLFHYAARNGPEAQRVLDQVGKKKVGEA